MKRVRNPRFAPEFLERKLSPSGVTADPGTSALYGDVSTVPAPVVSTDDSVVFLDPTASTVVLVDASSTISLNVSTSDFVASGDTSDDLGTSDPSSSDPGIIDGSLPFVPLPPAPAGPPGPGY